MGGVAAAVSQGRCRGWDLGGVEGAGVGRGRSCSITRTCGWSEKDREGREEVRMVWKDINCYSIFYLDDFRKLYQKFKTFSILDTLSYNHL